MKETLEEWKIEQKKAAYEQYVENPCGATETEYHLRLKLIDEIK